jgi:hypothetical protein
LGFWQTAFLFWFPVVPFSALLEQWGEFVGENQNFLSERERVAESGLECGVAVSRLELNLLYNSR